MKKYRQKVSFDIFKHISSKINPKHVPTPPNVSSFHLKSSHNKTQTVTWPKTHQNGRSKRNLTMRKVWKTYRFSHRDVILQLVCQWRRLCQSHCSTPASEEKCIGWKDVEVFLALGAIKGNEESLEGKWKNEGVMREWENQMMCEKERRGKFLYRK